MKLTRKKTRIKLKKTMIKQKNKIDVHAVRLSF